MVYKSGRPNNVGFTHRGFSYWTDGKAERLLVGTGDAYLISIDARTGKPDPAFGTDGKVDLSDFGILRDNFSTGTTFAQGDQTLDGKVDLADFFAFAAEFGSPGAAAVPEPSTWLLALVAAAGSLTLVRRRGASRHEGNQ